MQHMQEQWFPKNKADFMMEGGKGKKKENDLWENDVKNIKHTTQTIHSLNLTPEKKMFSTISRRVILHNILGGRY